MAKHITIQVPGKHPKTGELTTFELKGQRMDIDIGGQAMPFLIQLNSHIPHASKWPIGLTLSNSRCTIMTEVQQPGAISPPSLTRQ